MASDQHTDRQHSQREEWKAASQYTSHSSHHREERRDRASDQYANQPPPPPPPRRERRQPPDQYYQPSPQHMERESLLSRIKRKAAFWTVFSIGVLVIFVMVGVVYSAAGNLGLINMDFWMTNFGMICGLVASWWLYGQVLKKKFGYPSVFQ